MAGAVVIVIVLLVVLPIGFIVGGAAVAALLGSTLKERAEVTHEGSELIELNT